MAEFRDHPNKIIIREKWCLPILKHLRENLGYKLVYLGLPGIEGLDILTWINYLDYIIAIDCGDYSRNYDFELANENFKKLNRLLLKLETEKKISGFSLFLGYIEQVILKGYDENGNKFSQHNLVHIYNLDFCNTLNSPLRIVDIKGNVNKHYKLEVIRKLVGLQRDLCKTNQHDRFIMFVTVRSDFWKREAEVFFSNNPNDEFSKYYNSIKGLENSEKKIRLLRYYFFDIIKSHFTSNSFIPEFFPPVYYKGLRNSKLICFTITGTYIQGPSAIAPFYQQLDEIINYKFLGPNESNIININTVDSEINTSSNPIDHLVNFNSYKDLW